MKKTSQKLNLKYRDEIDTLIDRVVQLIESKKISARFGGLLLNYMIKKKIKFDFKNYLNHLINYHFFPHTGTIKEKIFYINYESKKSNFI